jgi:arsenite-transporting ATPase
VSLHDLFGRKLLLITGKGGTGKTTLAAAIGRLQAERGRRVIVVEVDNFQSALTGPFGRTPGYQPITVAPNLDICNVTWKEALIEWLESTVPAQRIVRMILGNKTVQTFLDATPGARETMVLSRILTLTEQYDQVIVDMPASGHAVSILRVPHVAVNLMGSGPVGQRSRAVLSLFGSDRTALLIVGLPEEMVVNEMVELWEKLHVEVPELRTPLVVLNRAAIPTLTESERELLERLEAATPADRPLARELLQAGRWEAGLEASTAEALSRLKLEIQGAEVVSFPRLGSLGGFEGGPAQVVRQLAAALARQELAESRA